MHNAHTISLGEGSNEWRLPVSHEARVDIGFECQRAQHPSSPAERERVALGIAAVPAVYLFVMEPYQRERVDTFIAGLTGTATGDASAPPAINCAPSLWPRPM